MSHTNEPEPSRDDGDAALRRAGMVLKVVAAFHASPERRQGAGCDSVASLFIPERSSIGRTGAHQ